MENPEHVNVAITAEESHAIMHVTATLVRASPEHELTRILDAFCVKLNTVISENVPDEHRGCVYGD